MFHVRRRTQSIAFVALGILQWFSVASDAVVLDVVALGQAALKIGALDPVVQVLSHWHFSSRGHKESKGVRFR